MILPESEDRPTRLDLPWIRNLSWVKVHAMQIGFAVGLIVYWGQLLGMRGIAFGFAVAMAEKAFSLRKQRSSKSCCTHSIGVHDLREKPWYGLSAAIATWLLVAFYFGVPYA